MPLLDHFHPPLSNNAPWSVFHMNWAVKIVDRLNAVYLERRKFTAQSGRHFGAQVEVDGAALERPERGSLFAGHNGNGVSVTTTAPMISEPTISLSAAVGFTG